MNKIITEEQYQVVTKALDMAVLMLRSSGYPLIDKEYFMDMASRNKNVALCLSCRTIFVQNKDEDYCALCELDKMRGKK